MKRKVETRRTGEKSRKCITSTLQELSLRKSCFSDKKHASHQGKEPSLFLARAVFLAKKVFPACYFALHDSLRDTRPNGEIASSPPIKKTRTRKKVEAVPPEAAEPASVIQAESGETPSVTPPKRSRKKKTADEAGSPKDQEV